jgi:hypothetical protein
MRLTAFIFVTSLTLAACHGHWSGHLVRPSGNVPGRVPYRTDQGSESDIAERREDAIRKIEKYCGNEGYTITKEGPSSDPREKQLQFRCTGGPSDVAPIGNATASASPPASPAPTE